MIFDFLPKEATPRERAILCFYHIFEIKNPKELAKTLGYKHPSTVYRILKKYRGKIVFPYGVILQLNARNDPMEMK